MYKSRTNTIFISEIIYKKLYGPKKKTVTPLTNEKLFVFMSLFYDSLTLLLYDLNHCGSLLSTANISKHSGPESGKIGQLFIIIHGIYQG